MKHLRIFGLIAATVATISTTALAAYTDTDYFVIGRLQASSYSGGGFRVYPATGYVLPTIEGCSSNDFAEVLQAGPSGYEKDLMARQLQAAFWGNRKVKLRLDGCGASGRPAYRIVALSAGQ